jgi:ribosomal-protein-alanine N-acetyltransferase
MTLRRGGLADCEILGFLHGSCFPHEPWDASAFAGLLVSPGMFALIAQADGQADDQADKTGDPIGFVLARAIAGEAEIVAIGVDPTCRRNGTGAALLEGAIELARVAGAEAVFLEVAENNNQACQLYTRRGFIKIGRRANYYRQKDAAVAALVMKLELFQSSIDRS